MQFLVRRCVRNQVIYGATGLFLAALLVWGGSRYLAPMVGSATSGVVQPEVPPKKSLEQRKHDITQYLAAKYKQQTKVVRMYVDLAFHEANKHPDVEPELILAVIQKESSMGYTKRSYYGAEGPMQVVRRFHTDKLTRTESLMNPKVNLRVGTQILQNYISEQGALAPALVKYSGNARGYAEFVIRETRVLQAI